VTYLSVTSGARSNPAHLIAIALLALPWLWPFASGPTPSVLPRLAALAFGALYLLLYQGTPPENANRIYGKALLVAALVSSVIGLLQYFGASQALTPWVNVTVKGNAFGNLRQRNQLGSLLNMGLAVLVWSAWARHWRRETDVARDADSDRRRVDLSRTWVLGLTALAVVLLASASAATASRTGMVQMLAMLGLAFLWRRQTAKATWPMLVGSVLAYVVASGLLPVLIGQEPFASGITARFSDGGLNCESRIILWHNVLQLIAQKPWFGWGWGELDYAHFITVYPGTRFCDILDNAHNLPLHLAVELGLPLSVAFCSLLSWLVWRAKPWREPDSDRQMAWAVLLVIGLHSLLEYPLWYGPFQIATLFAIWILCRSPRPAAGAGGLSLASASPNAPVTAGSGLRAAIAIGAMLLLIALAYAAWDYRRVSQVYLAPSLRASAYREDTMRKVQDSVLFRNQARFAALTLATVTPENAAQLHATALELLHFSPESRVVEKLIDSALVLGRKGEAAYYMLRYRQAFPADYARWQARNSYEASLPQIAR
jgi:O-antigen ligase